MWQTLQLKETLIHSSSQAGFAILDAVQAQTADVAGLRRGFATRQCAKIRKWLRHEELISVS